MRNHLMARVALAGAVLAAVSVTGCSGSGTQARRTAGQTTPQTAQADAARAVPATVTTRSVSGLGKILVDGKGLTLYLFLADKTDKSTCTGGCAQAWPPLTVDGKPTAAGGVRGKLLSTSERDGGARQVTYDDHPLYRFLGDRKPGDVTGQGLDNFGAKWYVLGTDGKKITTTPSPRTPSGGYQPPPRPGG